MDMETTEIRSTLLEKYKHSEYARMAKSRMQQVSIVRGLDVEAIKGSQASWWKQLTTLTKRSFLNMSRDIGYYWSRIVIYTIVALCVGTLFYDVGTSYTAILARGACGGFVTGYMTFMSIGGFPSFVEEMRGMMMMTVGFFRLLAPGSPQAILALSRLVLGVWGVVVAGRRIQERHDWVGVRAYVPG